MKLIEKIEIHRFRSMSDASLVTDDITIFSGINNSGKSNILKALNLFFNRQSSFGQKFDFSKDYNKAFTGQAGGKRAIKITLHFGNQGDAALSFPFSISRTFELGKEDPQTEYQSKNDKIQAGIDKKDGNITRQFTRFLNKIEYFYVPAVRDRGYVRSLFLHFEKLIEHDSGKQFAEKIKDLSDVLTDKSSEISKDFEKFIGIPTEAILSSNIIDMLGTVEINVRTGIKVRRRLKKSLTKSIEKQDTYVNLFSSGDGILMSYLAYFLAHVCKTISNKKFIWGFEEPENSLEYSKVQKIAIDFHKDFKRNAQIFITTHSPAFIKLKDEEGVKFFRVYIKPDDEKQVSEIRTLNEIRSKQRSLFESGEFESSEYKKLLEELYFIEFAKEIEISVQKLMEEQRNLIEIKNKFESKYGSILKARPDKIFICEDSRPQAIELWEKWLKSFKLADIKVMSSEGSATKLVEDGVRHQKKLDSTYNPKIFRQIDRDSLTDEQIKILEEKIFSKESNDLFHEFKYLPVNEIENFAVLLNTDKFDTNFWLANQQGIVDEFQRTAEASCKKYSKIFDKESESAQRQKFIQDDGGFISMTQKMRDSALADKNKLLPGKEMCKKIANFNPINILAGISIEDYPQELKEYLGQIKSFFT